MELPIAVGGVVSLRPDMRIRFSQYLRLLTLAFAAACAVVLNHRHVAVVRVVADAVPTSPGTPVVAVGSHRVVVRERVSLESVHVDACTAAGPVAAWLPLLMPTRDPLGTWLQAKVRIQGLMPLAPARALTRAVSVFARLLGASVVPQAP